MYLYSPIPNNSQGSNGTLNAATITTLSNVGLCTYVSGFLTMPSTVVINGVPFIHDGVISGTQSWQVVTRHLGVSNISFINGATPRLSAKGRTQGQSQGTFLFSGDCTFLSSSVMTSVPDFTANRGATLSCNNLNLAAGCSILGTGFQQGK